MLDHILNFYTLLPINSVLLLPTTVSNIGTHTIYGEKYLKLHTSEQKIAHNDEKTSTDGYKNCEHLSTDAHHPVLIIHLKVRIKVWWRYWQGEQQIVPLRKPLYISTYGYFEKKYKTVRRILNKISSKKKYKVFSSSFSIYF